MTEIRFVRNEELTEAAALSDSVFRDADQTSMGVAFPHIFSAGLSQSVGAFEDGKMVAFMGLVPKIIRIGSAQLQIHCLGSVCTAPAYRGKGHASLMLDQVYDFIKQSGTSLLLVSGDRTLYTRTGCTIFGELNHYVITKQDAKMDQLHSGAHAINYRLLEATDTFQLHKLHTNNNVRYESSINDTAQLIDSKAVASIKKLNHKVYVAEFGEKLIASVIVAVPSKLATDAEPFIVEWNGVAKVAVSLISYVIQDLSLASLQLHSPWQEKELHEALGGISFTKVRNSGTIKMIDSKRLWNQLMPHLIEKNAYAASVIDCIENGASEAVHLSILGESVQIDYHEFIALIFDPNADIPNLKPYKSVLDSLFPIAFPYTAGLHYI
jgi:predicted N-acetyltransferase YhbS